MAPPADDGALNDPANPRLLFFEDEPVRPALGNLATHINKDHPKIRAAKSSDNAPEATSKPIDAGYTQESVNMMEGYLAEGFKNPALALSASGFLRLFSGWIIEDDQAFSAGTSTIHWHHQTIILMFF